MKTIHIAFSFVTVFGITLLISYGFYLKTKYLTMAIHRHITCNNCSYVNFPLIISNPSICNTANSKVKIVILIASAQNNFKARETARKTWLSPWVSNTGLIRYVFLLGWTQNKKLQTSLSEENTKYGDLLQNNFTDSYYNLTLKTIMGFKWTSQTCSHAQYVFKTDDDTFVNIKNLMKICEDKSKILQSSVGGNCETSPSVNKNLSSKWYVSEETYPFSIFPGYCGGSGYVTSMTVIQRIVHTYNDVTFIYLEDVYIGLCLSILGFGFIDIEGFHINRVEPISCDYKGDHLVTSHRISPQLMEGIWKMPCHIT